MRLRVRPVTRLAGQARVPGDKSISHRAALLGAVADGVTEVRGYLEAEDCLRSLTAAQALGAEVTRKGPGEYRIAGVGLSGLSEAGDVIDCGNSGTTARLLLGVLAGQPFTTVLTGDESLRRRPMARVAEPLGRMGATFLGRAGNSRLPFAVRGVRPLKAIAYDTPVASAQVKSAVLLAGLWADGPVTVREPAHSRDHSERMLQKFGARVETHGLVVRVMPGPLTAAAVDVPGDISSAAFLLVAGAIVPGARIAVADVGVNPTRTGVLDALAAMGAPVARGDATDRDEPATTAPVARGDATDRDEPATTAPVARGDATDRDEPATTLTVTAAELRGTTIAGELIPRLIDEIPVLAVAAAVARGATQVRDAAELRVKESDRIAALAGQLGRMGVRITERADGFHVDGGPRLRGSTVTSGGDHRLAMALAVAGLVADGETVVEDTACIRTSFPNFVELMNALAGDEALVELP